MRLLHPLHKHRRVDDSTPPQCSTPTGEGVGADDDDDEGDDDDGEGEGEGDEPQRGQEEQRRAEGGDAGAEGQAHAGAQQVINYYWRLLYN